MLLVVAVWLRCNKRILYCIVTMSNVSYLLSCDHLTAGVYIYRPVCVIWSYSSDLTTFGEASLVAASIYKHAAVVHVYLSVTSHRPIQWINSTFPHYDCTCKRWWSWRPTVATSRLLLTNDHDHCHISFCRTPTWRCKANNLGFNCRPCCYVWNIRTATASEMEMGQWVMGQMGHHFWMGHMGHESLPVTHWPMMMK